MRRPPPYLREDLPRGKWILRTTATTHMHTAREILMDLDNGKIHQIRRFTRRAVRKRRKQTSSRSRGGAQQHHRHLRQGERTKCRIVPRPPPPTTSSVLDTREKMVRQILRLTRSGSNSPTKTTTPCDPARASPATAKTTTPECRARGIAKAATSLGIISAKEADIVIRKHTQLVRVHKSIPSLAGPTSCTVSTFAQPRSGEVLLLLQAGPGNCNNSINCSKNEESSSGVGDGQQGRQKPGRQHFDGAAAAAVAMAAPRSDSFLSSTAAETGKITTNNEDGCRFWGLFPRGRHPPASLPKGKRPGGGVAAENNTTRALGGGAGSRRSRSGAAFLAAGYAIGRVSHGTRRLVGHPVDVARLDFKLSSRRQEMAARREEERLGARKRQQQRREWLSVLCTVVPFIALAENLESS
ncbi:unnamed protein product [Ectocarpus sp. 8 AP-2014]